MHTGTSKDHMLEMEVLTDENISPAFKRIKYGIRGWLEDRTYEIKQELARVSIVYSQRAFQRLIMVGSGLGVRLVKYPHCSSIQLHCQRMVLYPRPSSEIVGYLRS